MVPTTPSPSPSQEIPMVFPSNQRTKDISIMNMVFSDVLSNMNPYTVIPALLFSKYTTAIHKLNPHE